MSENFTFIEQETLSDYLRFFGWILTNQVKTTGKKTEYSEWSFLQEKEWVLAKHTEQLLTFSTLAQWPKASKFRC